MGVAIDLAAMNDVLDIASEIGADHRDQACQLVAERTGQRRLHPLFRAIKQRDIGIAVQFIGRALGHDIDHTGRGVLTK